MPAKGIVNINIIFTEAEHKKLLKKKEQLNLDWHDFFMTLLEEKNE